MPFFRPFQELTPIFRLLDDYAVASQRHGFPGSQGVRSFQPSFDVRETKDAYELQGDLPGIASQDVSVEWQDDQTLTISGHSSHSSETAPADEAPAAETASEEAEVAESSSAKFQATVEDSNDEPATPTTADEDWTEVAKQPETTKEPAQEAPKPASQHPKYWVSERSYGKFSRTWKFPSRVDTENVTASLKDGILSIVVPKASPFEPKKVAIE
jgi:HSP20 family protein